MAAPGELKAKRGGIPAKNSGSVAIARAKNFFFDRAIVRDHLVGSTFSAIRSTSAYVQKVAINSMKRGQLRKRGKNKGKAIHSKPGKPPKYWRGLIRKFLWFAFDPRTSSSVIGPVQLGDGTVLRDLEIGNPAKGIEPRPYMRPAFEKGKVRLMDRIRATAQRKALKGKI